MLSYKTHDMLYNTWLCYVILHTYVMLCYITHVMLHHRCYVMLYNTHDVML